MKDSNDAQTIDWVDSANAETDTLLIAPPVNPALNTALTKIVNVTLQDLLAEYN